LRPRRLTVSMQKRGLGTVIRVEMESAIGVAVGVAIQAGNAQTGLVAWPGRLRCASSSTHVPHPFGIVERRARRTSSRPERVQILCKAPSECQEPRAQITTATRSVTETGTRPVASPKARAGRRVMAHQLFSPTLDPIQLSCVRQAHFAGVGGTMPEAAAHGTGDAV
jgi:hypothetical protein